MIDVTTAEAAQAAEEAKLAAERQDTTRARETYLRAAHVIGNLPRIRSVL